MPEHQGPEPTGWELMRGLERVQESVDALGGRVVSTDLFKAHIDSEERRIGDVEADVAEIKKDNAARATREQAREDDQRRAKAGLYASVALGVAAIAASFIVPFIHGGA